MTVEKIVEKFGGLTRMTTLLGLKYPSIIQGWVRRNSIPTWRLSLVQTKAMELGLDINYETKGDGNADD